jgi:hypothetical protein
MGLSGKELRLPPGGRGLRRFANRFWSTNSELVESPIATNPDHSTPTWPAVLRGHLCSRQPSPSGLSS